MSRSLILTSTLLLATLTFSPAPLRANPIPPTPGNPPVNNFGIDNPGLRRAMNLARQAAERTNGGLNNYRAEAAMYGTATQSPFVDNGNGTWTFTFRGGPPGWTTPTLETAVTVSQDGSQVTIDYNGPLRSAEVPAAPAPIGTSAGEESIALRRAMNLARQAAERANGGLENYRAEAAMYGSTDQAPVVDNGNGTWTFTFQGGPPGSTAPTVESEITVSRDRQVTINYNGPLRNNSGAKQGQPQG